jgi:hypothetical protein
MSSSRDHVPKRAADSHEVFMKLQCGNSWSQEIKEVSILFVTESQLSDCVLFEANARSICRLIASDGYYRECCGHGSRKSDSKFEAISNAEEAAISDALIKCSESFQRCNAHTTHIGSTEGIDTKKRRLDCPQDHCGQLLEKEMLNEAEAKAVEDMMLKYETQRRRDPADQQRLQEKSGTISAQSIYGRGSQAASLQPSSSMSTISTTTPAPQVIHSKKLSESASALSVTKASQSAPPFRHTAPQSSISSWSAGGGS